jgi:hypothetical protein
MASEQSTGDRGIQEPLELNLDQDYAEVYAHLAARVASFDPAHNNAPGRGQLVKRIDIGYEYDQSAWVVVTFDTRPDAEPDGQWTLYWGNQIARPHWLEANEALRERVVSVLWDGTWTEIEPEYFDELGVMIGRMLLSVLLHARANGMFAALPKASDCTMGVENRRGVYAWPAYERHGKINRV